jgi:tRNA(fMet)-specific endonuclease VapC
MMAVYMLDTGMSSYIMKRSHDSVLSRLRKVPVGNVFISSITKSELMFGVEVSSRRQQNQAALDVYLRHVRVLDYPDNAGPHYAEIRAELKSRNDEWCERSADRGAIRRLGLTLVTNNTREFGRVQGLNIENWTEPNR